MNPKDKKYTQAEIDKLAAEVRKNISILNDDPYWTYRRGRSNFQVFPPKKNNKNESLIIFIIIMALLILATL